MGTLCVAGLAHAGGNQTLRGTAIAHAMIAAGPDELVFESSHRSLREADVTRREVDARDHLAEFGLSPETLGITERRISIASTPFVGALAEIIETKDGRRIVIWDGVAYQVDAS